jgi:hypothetical protein
MTKSKFLSPKTVSFSPGHLKIRACFEFRASDFEFLSLNTILRNYQEIHKRIKPSRIKSRGHNPKFIIAMRMALSA